MPYKFNPFTGKFDYYKSPVTDHGLLTGLSDDDHQQYALLAGRSGGQTINGDTAASGTLTLSSTAHATKGKIIFGSSVYDEVNNRLGIGVSSPTCLIDMGVDTQVSTTRQTMTTRNAGYAPPTAPNTLSNGDKYLFWNSTTYKGGVGMGTSQLWFQSSGETASNIAFFTASAVVTPIERMRIDSSGNIMMGRSTSPLSLLTLGVDTVVSSSRQGISIGNSGFAAPVAANSNSDGDKLSLWNTATLKIALGVAPNQLWFQSSGSSSANIAFFTASSGTPLERMRIDSAGNLGIGTTSPTNDLSFSGNATRKVWLERHTTANTAGNALTLQAGGATAAATDKNGGQLILQGGQATGTGESGVTLQGCVAGASGTADRSFQDMVKVLGNKLGFYTATPVTQPTVTGSRGGNAALASLLTALAGLGLVVDGSTA